MCGTALNIALFLTLSKLLASERTIRSNIAWVGWGWGRHALLIFWTPIKWFQLVGCYLWDRLWLVDWGSCVCVIADVLEIRQEPILTFYTAPSSLSSISEGRWSATVQHHPAAITLSLSSVFTSHCVHHALLSVVIVSVLLLLLCYYALLVWLVYMYVFYLLSLLVWLP